MSEWTATRHLSTGGWLQRRNSRTNAEEPLVSLVQESLPRNWCCLQWAVSSHIYQHLRQLTIDQPDLDNSSTETLPSAEVWQIHSTVNEISHQKKNLQRQNSVIISGHCPDAPCLLLDA
uniref:Predicted gene, EG235327 n=1 Tax=Mus musculus TaxID=10090 RepID=Q8CA09_MOUSE|nr:Predicted gene, EG235327 [Mus musculus]BAC30494.1 unnamed protein product [Mus musculus]|eukprot:NP_808369.1 uncharacterized protein LOC235327 [Mus musculus]